jgi:hypothetical protein
MIVMDASAVGRGLLDDGEERQVHPRGRHLPARGLG